MKFKTVVEQSGKTATGIPVPAETVTALGAGKKPAVTVTINGYTYRSTIATLEGVFMIALSAENRLGAGVSAGDEIEVTLELDNQPRKVDVPPDFIQALDPYPEARRFFDGLSYSKQRWFVLNIEGTKNPETRLRRIEKAVAMLREGKAP